MSGKNKMSVFVALLALLPVAAIAGPIVEYSYPASWDGVAATVTDLSPAGNDGIVAGTPTLSAAIPPGADPLTESLYCLNGGHRTSAVSLLANPVLEASGGFSYDVWFMWDGEQAGFSVQKILDYAGTEFLQLESLNYDAGTADLRFGFNDEAGLGPTMGINENTWYHVLATFDTQGNVVAGDGSIDGMASMVVDGGAPISVALTKTNFGDGLARGIAFGTLAAGSGIVNLSGNVYNPTVSLLPEPNSLMLLTLGGLALLRRR